MLTSRNLGFLFLVVTAASWIGASFITQALVSPRSRTEGPELEPWLLTLICSSTFTLYLPFGYYARKRSRSKAAAAAAKGRSCLGGGTEGGDAGDSELAGDACTGEESASTSARSRLEQQPLLQQQRQQQRLRDPGQRGKGVGGLANGADDGGGDGAAGVGGGNGGHEGSQEAEMETPQILKAAILVAPVWFAAQLTFTASLQFTSVTSNTVLSSCSSLFVYLGSLALGQEAGSGLRFTSVVAAMTGTALVALGDSRSKAGGGGGSSTSGGGSVPLLGDALTLLAAALYAAYTLIMKRMLRKDDAAVTALFFGFIGLLCGGVLLPLVSLLAAAGAQAVTRVTARALGLALLQGLIDYVAADYAWARAVMLLGPTATSCGLAMQIPAAGIVDAVVHGGKLAWSDTPMSLAQFLIGSLLIVGGFIGVSLDPRVTEAAWRRWRGQHRLDSDDDDDTPDTTAARDHQLSPAASNSNVPRWGGAVDDSAAMQGVGQGVRPQHGAAAADIAQSADSYADPAISASSLSRGRIHASRGNADGRGEGQLRDKGTGPGRVTDESELSYIPLSGAIGHPSVSGSPGRVGDDPV